MPRRAANSIRVPPSVQLAWPRGGSADADGEFALGVVGAESCERVGCLGEVVAGVDRDLESVGEELSEAVEVRGGGVGHDHRSAGAFACGSGGRGDAAAVLDE